MNEEKTLSEETKNLFIEYFKVPGETPDNPIGFPLIGLEIYGSTLDFRFKTGEEKGQNLDIQLQLLKDEQSGYKFFKIKYFKPTFALPFFTQGENVQLNLHKTSQLIMLYQKIDFLINKFFDPERGFIWNQTFALLCSKALEEVGVDIDILKRSDQNSEN